MGDVIELKRRKVGVREGNEPSGSWGTYLAWCPLCHAECVVVAMTLPHQPVDADALDCATCKRPVAFAVTEAVAARLVDGTKELRLSVFAAGVNATLDQVTLVYRNTSPERMGHALKALADRLRSASTP